MFDGEDKVIQDAVAGEASAFGLLYDHYQPKIYRFVLVKVSHREEAEDLTHQIFLHAFEHIGRYERMGFPFSSWLYRIARNAVIDHYRTKKHPLSLDEVDESLFAAHDPQNLSLDERIDLDRVMKAIRTLKEEYQDVLLMRFVEDLSPREVAAALDKSEGSVKLIQHRAVRELKKILTA